MIVFRWRVNPVVAWLIAATLVLSLVVAIDARAGGALSRQLALIPRDVWRGQLWRLVTWFLIERSPLSLVFACVTLYWFGGELSWSWGTRRLARFVAAMVAVASIGTVLLALLVPLAWRLPHLGGYALGSALVVAWALEFPDRRIRVYQLLVVGGPVLAYGTVALTALFAVFYGVAWFLPELLAGGAALVHMTGNLGPRLRRLRIRLRGLLARLRLGVLAGGRHGGPFGPS